MRFEPPLRRGRLIRRYKRFFADLELEGIGEVTAHCPNTGSLRGCLVPGAPVLAHHSDDPRRRLAWTWAAVEIDGTWVGVWSARAEALVREAIEGGELLPELAGYPTIQTQVAYGGGRSRIDLLLGREGDPRRIYVEVKSTTMRLAPGVAAFPDAVTERGRKHLDDLRGVVLAGHRAALVLVVQRGECPRFAPAEAIDPAWTAALRRAIRAGVEVYALGVRLDEHVLEASHRLALEIDGPARGRGEEPAQARSGVGLA